jgi:hypothetical protein
VKILTASVMTSTPDPYVGEEWLTWIRVGVWGGGQKAGPKGSQNPARGGGDHVGGALAAGDHSHCIEGA